MSDPNTDLLATTTETDSGSTSGTGTTTYLDRLVGPDKQFKDIETVAKAKVDADEFIKQMQELEKSATTKAAMAEVLNELKSRQSNEPSNQPAISDDEFARRVRATFDSREAEKAEAANVASANMLLLKKFDGDSELAKKYLASKLSELNLNGTTVRNLAKSSPAAFAELLGLAKKDASTTTAPTHIKSTVQSPVGNPSGGEGQRNSAYYNALLKTMGPSKFYNDKALLNQKEADMVRLGDAYLSA